MSDIFNYYNINNKNFILIAKDISYKLKMKYSNNTLYTIQGFPEYLKFIVIVNIVHDHVAIVDKYAKVISDIRNFIAGI